MAIKRPVPMFELSADENEAQSSPTIHLPAATGKRGGGLMYGGRGSITRSATRRYGPGTSRGGRIERLHCFGSAGAVAWAVGHLLWRRLKLVEDVSHAGHAAQRFHERDALVLEFQFARERDAAVHHDRAESRLRSGAGAFQAAID